MGKLLSFYYHFLLHIFLVASQKIYYQRQHLSYLSVVNCVQIEGESWCFFHDSICSQQTLKIHKKYKTKEIPIIVYYIDGLKHNLDFFLNLFEKCQFHFKLCNTSRELAHHLGHQYLHWLHTILTRCCLYQYISVGGARDLVHSVQKIVAPACVQYRSVLGRHTGMPFFNPLKPYFNVCALFF